MSRRYFILLIVVVLAGLGIASFLLKQDPCQTIGDGSVVIELFHSNSCPACAKARSFFGNLVNEYPEIQVKQCEISNKAVSKKMIERYAERNVSKEAQGLIPFILTKDKYFVGFNDAIAKELEGCIVDCVNVSLDENNEQAPFESVDKEHISIPIIGEIDMNSYSMPVLAVILGFFDGFNVCSLGALALILALVLSLGSRKKVLFFGGVFIVVTGLIYGSLIFIWQRIFVVFSPYIKMMEIIIGLLGVAGGIYFLKEFFRIKKQDTLCHIASENNLISRLSSKMRAVLQGDGNTILILLSIVFFASAITIIEFPCSAVVPGMFAAMLEQTGATLAGSIFYISLFVLFYMIDEIIVFSLAVLTMNLKLISKKFVLYAALAEAIILSILGLYYLFGFLIF